jgi:hypothetical protein
MLRFLHLGIGVGQFADEVPNVSAFTPRFRDLGSD